MCNLPVRSYAELGLLSKHRDNISTHGFVYKIIVMVSLQICLVAIGTKSWSVLFRNKNFFFRVLKAHL